MTKRKQPALPSPMNYALLRVEFVAAVEVSVCDEHADLANDEASEAISDALHLMHLGGTDITLLGTRITPLQVSEVKQ
jgi:hypothetical protein